MKLLTVSLYFQLLSLTLATNDYFSWIVGSSADVVTNPQGGTLIQGGGHDQDEAMRWMLRRADRGDVVVLRDGKHLTTPPSTADAYNPYFFHELGVTVDSVETIFLNGRHVANNPEVVQKVRNAECLFFTGGDQLTYYAYIKNTPLYEAIDYLKNEKKVPVGGTSAGCAIQSHFAFTAENDTVVSSDALANPYDYRVTIEEFFKTPYLHDTVLDSHYSQRNRYGRHVVFMARMYRDYTVHLPSGIGLDAKTALAIDQNGIGSVFGEGVAFFMIQNQRGGFPERIERVKPLDWYRDRRALMVHSLNGTLHGNKQFNLVHWAPVGHAACQYWFVDHGSLHHGQFCG